MINYESFELTNGLKVIVHPDQQSPTVAFNLIYNVGSRDENPNKTGFAHLFEHLMFGGSENIPDYDIPLQKVGAQNNAYTTPDITNYYITLPQQNLETAFWLESDRMKALSFDQKVLDIQKSVVIEEFKQRYLNQPYGDLMLKLRPLVYQNHSYSWATIGKSIEHIESFSMDDVKDFFYKYYLPNNACLVVGGYVKTTEIEKLSKKWFGDIPAGFIPQRNLPQNELIAEPIKVTIEKSMPQKMLSLAYLMPPRFDSDYYNLDFLSDTLGQGKASYFYQKLVSQKKLFTNCSAYHTGSLDQGMFIISASLQPEIDYELAEKEIQMTMQKFINEDINAEEIQRAKTQLSVSEGFQDVNLLNRCVKLAYAANAGNPNKIELENQLYQDVSLDSIIQSSKEHIFQKNHVSLRYGI
jgi:zinc protease